VLRLEGFGPSVQVRQGMLQALAPGLRVLSDDEVRGFWSDLRNPLPGAETLWRVSVPPSRGPAVVEAIGGDWLMDWAGGLVWSASSDAAGVRQTAIAAGGHAMLVRGPEALRAQVPALHPPDPGVAALEARVRRAFDPAGVFETGRF
jgi:glycolate oxidase FAD binding subunit